ncbi:MAG: hypothetical protein OEY52_05210 [Gammaproteobacteria bacterium]|nr:hypothetical protein [Gammaproteobacteria bacterium]
MKIKSILLVLVSVGLLGACVPYTGITKVSTGKYIITHPKGVINCISKPSGDLKCDAPTHRIP